MKNTCMIAPEETPINRTPITEPSKILVLSEKLDELFDEFDQSKDAQQQLGDQP